MIYKIINYIIRSNSPEGSWETQMSQFETYATISGSEGHIKGLSLAPSVPVLSSDGKSGPFWNKH